MSNIDQKDRLRTRMLTYHRAALGIFRYSESFCINLPNFLSVLPAKNKINRATEPLKKNRCSNHKLAEENMPASMLMIAIDWYGSFDSLKSARLQSQQSGVEEFLYFAISTDGKDRSYVGLSSNATGRLTEAHHVLGGLNVGYIDLWIGLNCIPIRARTQICRFLCRSLDQFAYRGARHCLFS